MKWQPIDTAPKDGEKILLYVPNIKFPQYSKISIGKWDNDKYVKKPRPYWDYGELRVTDMRNKQPTHWMPLPEPPVE